MTEVTSSSTIPLPPRLLVAIFRVDIYYERGLGRSNIAFKKLGRTALNHDRIINHDCLNTCRKDRSTDKILLDDFHLCFLRKRLVSLNFLIKLRKLITKGAESLPKRWSKRMNHHQGPDSRLQHRFTLKTMRLQVVTSTGVCACFFTATVHISSEATSPSDLKRVKGIAVGIETCERRKKKKREKKTKR